MRLLVIGADATGMSAAGQVKRKLGDAVEVTVLNDQQWTSYSACGIPYWIAGDFTGGPEALVARTPEQHRANGLDVHIGVRAVAIDPTRHQVRAQSVTDPEQERTYDYDQLVIGTGAAAVVPPLPGIEGAGVVPVHTIDDGLAALELLEQQPRNAVVVGGGFIGVEMAEACVQRGLRTTVVDLAEEPLTPLDPDMSALVRGAMESAGVDFRGGEPVAEFLRDDDGRITAVRTQEASYPADVVFLGMGVKPRGELASAAGLPVGATGGILIDEHCRVQGSENIWAGGDCVENTDRLTGRHSYLPLGTHANKHGRVIGLNIAGEPTVFPGIIGTAITKFLDTEIARVGLREAEALELGRDVRSVVVGSVTRAGYYPGSAKVKVKMLGEVGTGRVLGCQIIGGPGAGKRIDTAATAIWNEMTAAEMIDLDLAYAPPLSPVWDPVVSAARVLAPKLLA